MAKFNITDFVNDYYDTSGLHIRLLTIKEKNNDLIAEFTSGRWKQYIKFVDYKKYKDIYDIGIQVYCTCPAYTYNGYKYVGTLEGYNFSEYSERRRPKKDYSTARIVKVCKHLLHIFNNFDDYVSEIMEYIEND